MNRPPRERHWRSSEDRARVAAELIEEAASLSDTGAIAGAAGAAAPGAVLALMDRGVSLARRGLWAGAAAQLRQALALDPALGPAWYYLGDALNHVDDLTGALRAFERAVQLQPADAKALYGVGKVLDRLHRPDEATVMYRRAREARGR